MGCQTRMLGAMPGEDALEYHARGRPGKIMEGKAPSSSSCALAALAQDAARAKGATKGATT